jgi:hypothetical protein
MLCLWSDQFEFMARFMNFNLWNGSDLVFEVLYVIFNFSIAIFLLPSD